VKHLPAGPKRREKHKMNTLEALKLAYRKHVLGDQNIGWEELCSAIANALCNEIGDEAFQKFVEDFYHEQANSKE
jgi:hypothetical protein